MILLDCLHFLITHSALINLITSVILVIATTVYVIFTIKLVKETRKSREIELEPHLTMYLESGEINPTFRYLVVENLGKGIAYNVKFNVLKDVEYEGTPGLKEISIITSGVKYFPGNRKYKYILTNVEKRYSDNDFIEIKVCYEGKLKDKHTDTFKLNVLHNQSGDGKLTPPDSYFGMISHNLNKINDSIKKQTKND